MRMKSSVATSTESHVWTRGSPLIMKSEGCGEGGREGERESERRVKAMTTRRREAIAEAAALDSGAAHHCPRQA